MAEPSALIPVSGEWASSFDLPVRHVSDEEQPRGILPLRPAARLSIVLPFIAAEVPRVLRLLDLIGKLAAGNQLDRTLYLLPFKGLDFAKVKLRAATAFSDVRLITDHEGVTSDWQIDSKLRDAAGPNSFFRQAAWLFELQPGAGPWLWLEPDCVPLARDWIEQLEADHRAGGKPFTGTGMKWQQTGKGYLNGAAIYPPNVVSLAPSLVTRTMLKESPEIEVSFDVVGGEEVFKRSHLSDLIQIQYRADEAPEPRPGVVLCHGDRGGKLLQKLLSGGSDANNNESRNGSLSHPATLDSPAQKTFVSAVPLGTTVGSSATVTTTIMPVPAPTVGDQIRDHVRALAELATNSNRRTRILAELRKRKLSMRR